MNQGGGGVVVKNKRGNERKRQSHKDLGATVIATVRAAQIDISVNTRMTCFHTSLSLAKAIMKW